VKELKLIEVSLVQVDDCPNAVAFMLEPQDGAKMTAQQMLDALADYLLTQYEDIFLEREQSLH
jgi:hypothetical protein